jgi:diadenosine tetraphosphate (Ap4A) HIT family hydrolase
VLRGYCLLLPDPVVPHLNAMALRDRERFMTDLATLGQAVFEAVRPVRINYALFGNVEPVLHGHVLPRYETEPEALRKAHPWAYDWSVAPAFDIARDGPLLAALRAWLATAPQA